jgi:hypothetical protein
MNIIRIIAHSVTLCAAWVVLGTFVALLSPLLLLDRWVFSPSRDQQDAQDAAAIMRQNRLLAAMPRKSFRERTTTCN